MQLGYDDVDDDDIEERIIFRRDYPRYRSGQYRVYDRPGRGPQGHHRTPSVRLNPMHDGGRHQTSRRSIERPSINMKRYPPAEVSQHDQRFHAANEREMELREQNRMRNFQKTNADRSKFRNRIKNMEKNFDDVGTDHTQVAVNPANENAVIRFLASERVFGYPKTTGSICSNYTAFVKNNHPFFSIFFMHRKHPFDRIQRLFAFFCTLCFSIFITYLFYQTDYVPQIASCRSGCNIGNATVFSNFSIPNDTTSSVVNQIIPLEIDIRRFLQVNINNDSVNSTISSFNSTAEICVGGYNDGLAYDDYNARCGLYQPWMLAAICGALTLLYDTLLKCSTSCCGCVQGRECFYSWLCCCCRRLVEYVGKKINQMFTAVSLGLLGWTLYECYINKANFSLIPAILLAECWSFLEWFVWSAPFFSYRYPLDKRHFYRHLPPPQSDEEVELTPPTAPKGR